MTPRAPCIGFRGGAASVRRASPKGYAVRGARAAPKVSAKARPKAEPRRLHMALLTWLS